jgi:hypothetical protein
MIRWSIVLGVLCVASIALINFGSFLAGAALLGNAFTGLFIGLLTAVAYRYETALSGARRTGRLR